MAPLGRPIANTRVYVRDEAGWLVPAGVPGELYIGGAGVARGYRNRPDLTAERFVPDPWGDEPGARLYRTGDLVRWRSDGVLEFLGRTDHQVKVRGFRIELGEIESALLEVAAVKQAVVVPRENGTGDMQLVAYVVFGPGVESTVTELRASLRERLPAYMVPSSFAVLDSLPLTPNGKVDRKALPIPTRDNSALDNEYVGPRTSLEKKLVHIWESALGIKPVGIRDNIFELGVDSLIAAQLFARIERTLGKDLPPAPLFRAPTIESLANLLEREDPSLRRWTSLVPIQPRGNNTPLFCVHGAAGTALLFQPLANQLADDRPVYAFQAQGLYGRDMPHTSTEEMGAQVEEMSQLAEESSLPTHAWRLQMPKSLYYQCNAPASLRPTSRFSLSRHHQTCVRF